ncbi:MAG: hypothetical protein KJ767_02615 [Nanoarchaeota archaeon]|nr:hypothetical protein [Nanoarchaeota archaeon]
MRIKLSPELAEILGMFAADGCLQSRYACMWGNINQDKEYYDNVVCPLFSKVFKNKVIAHEKKSNSVYGFYLCGKDVVAFFEKFGFNIGKKTYNVEVPRLILESNNSILYSSFIRGFTDCDGCINFLRRATGKYSHFKKNYHTYPRIFIKSTSNNVIQGISNMLSELDIQHSLEKQSVENSKKGKGEVFSTVIRGTTRLDKWMNLIGFNNPVQQSKYDIWKKYSFCPANTTFSQRKKILNGKLNPLSFY